jgi:hypothetical protein
MASLVKEKMDCFVAALLAMTGEMPKKGFE